MSSDRRQSIFEAISSYLDSEPPARWRPGRDLIPYAGPCVGEQDIVAVVNALLDGWWGVGGQASRLEREISRSLGQEYAWVTNSGSSANLLATTALCSQRLDRPLQAGDEVITPALTFPTTVNPIVQNQLTPVFVDIDPGTLNMAPDDVVRAIGPRTRAIVFPHTLGNPMDMDIVTQLAREHDLRVIEDCCDALGGRFDGRPVGCFGDFATVSMYVSHHVTMGEGGAVACGSRVLADAARSLRDWGRDCWCSGKETLLSDGGCGKRFSRWLDDVDELLDHRYVYTHIGYNLKPIELQCALGLQQINRLDDFIGRRRSNWSKLRERFARYEDAFQFQQVHPRAEPSWFGFAVTVRESAGFSRAEFLQVLENARIQTRVLFTGNILRHPAYRGIEHRTVSDLRNADRALSRSLFLGVWPGITDEQITYIGDVLDSFMGRKRAANA